MRVLRERVDADLTSSNPSRQFGDWTGIANKYVELPAVGRHKKRFAILSGEAIQPASHGLFAPMASSPRPSRQRTQIVSADSTLRFA